MELEKFNYMLQIDNLRSSSQNIWCSEGSFWRVWVSKRYLDALLAKTMRSMTATHFELFSCQQYSKEMATPDQLMILKSRRYCRPSYEDHVITATQDIAIQYQVSLLSNIVVQFHKD